MAICWSGGLLLEQAVDLGLERGERVALLAHGAGRIGGLGGGDVLEGGPDGHAAQQNGGGGDQEGLAAVCGARLLDDRGNQIDVDLGLADAAQAEADEFAHQVAFALDHGGIDTLADGEVADRIEVLDRAG